MAFFTQKHDFFGDTVIDVLMHDSTTHTPSFLDDWIVSLILRHFEPKFVFVFGTQFVFFCKSDVRALDMSRTLE